MNTLLKYVSKHNRKEQILMTPYIWFNRDRWSALHASISMSITASEIAQLKKINKNLSLEEISEIYLPLSCLLNFYYTFNSRRQTILDQFLEKNNKTVPYIIGIAGSIAVGKSTTARILQVLLSRWPEHRHIELIATDGFLHSNQILKERNLMKKKGFPQSYDMHRMVQFVSNLKSGVSNITAPIYSHLIYDVISKERKTISHPDILILEGLNILQGEIEHSCESNHVFVSDFIDFSIYIDAPENLLKVWYIERFLKFREVAFTNPNFYFHNYANLTKGEAINIASSLWNEINYINLIENILPMRERASLILTKSENHIIDKVQLRQC